MAVPRQSTWSEYISSIVNLTLDKCYIFDIEINQKSVKKTKTESAKLICINFIFYSELKCFMNILLQLKEFYCFVVPAGMA